MRKILLHILLLIGINTIAQEKIDSSIKKRISVRDTVNSYFSDSMVRSNSKNIYGGTIRDGEGNSIYTSVQIYPEFVGGSEAWKTFLSENLDVNTLKKNLKRKDFVYGQFKQTAFVSFTVNIDGSLCDFKIENEVHPLVKEEALKVLKLSPKWKPALLNGIVTKSTMKQKITFVVNKN